MLASRTYRQRDAPGRPAADGRFSDGVLRRCGSAGREGDRDELARHRAREPRGRQCAGRDGSVYVVERCARAPRAGWSPASASRVIATLGEPAFYLTIAIAQAVIVLIGIRLFDRYEPEPLVLIGLVALWGATGAAAISIAGNRALKGTLSGNYRRRSSATPLPPRSSKRRRRAPRSLSRSSCFRSVDRETVRRRRVRGPQRRPRLRRRRGLGFALTEDFVFFLDRANQSGLTAGVDLFVSAADFFGPAVLHHAIFTAAFGAGLGLATWTTRRSLKILFPLAGFALALLMHGANNGLLELGLTLKYGLEHDRSLGRRRRRSSRRSSTPRTCGTGCWACSTTSGSSPS